MGFGMQSYRSNILNTYSSHLNVNGGHTGYACGQFYGLGLNFKIKTGWQLLHAGEKRLKIGLRNSVAKLHERRKID